MRKELYDLGVRALHPLRTAEHRRLIAREWEQIEAQLAELGRSVRDGAVLVGRIWNLGDVAASTALLPAIREAHPKAVLVYAASPRYLEFLNDHLLVDRTIPCSCLGQLLRVCSLTVFDKVYLLHFLQEGCSYCASRVSESWNHSGLRVDQWPRSGLHIADAMARNGGIDARPEVMRIAVSQQSRQAAMCILEKAGSDSPRVALHLYSRVEHKNPSRAWWKSLVSRLTNDLGVKIILVGGGPEMERMESGGEMAGVLDPRADLSVAQMAAVIAECDLFIGPESGPAYIAETVGTRAIVLKGHYLPPEIVGPRNDTTVSVVSPVDCWTGKAILDSCPRSPSCMEGISVDDVYEAAQRELRPPLPQ